MNSEFSPISESVVAKYRPVDLNAVETGRMLTKFQVLNQEAEDKLIDPVFKKQAERVEVIQTEFSEIQKQTLDVLFTHNIPVDENTNIVDCEVSLDQIKELARGLTVAIEQGQWQPNVWRKELGNEKYKLGLDLLRSAIKAKEGQSAADYKSRLQVLIRGRGLGISSGGNSEANRAGIVKLCREMEKRADDPNTLWRVFTDKRVIPEQLIEDTEGIINMMQVYKICQEIDVSNVSPADKKLLKAQALVPYIDKGVNAVFIDEIVEGRYSFDETFFNTVVEGLAGIKSIAVSETEYSRKKASQTQKRDAAWYQRDIKRMTVTSLVAWSILTGNYAFTNQRIMPEAISASVDEITAYAARLPDLIGARIQETAKSAQESALNPPGEGQPVADYSKIPYTRNENAQVKKEGDNHKVATNVGANEFLAQSKVIDWDVEGENSGYFKLGTSSQFNYQEHTWTDNVDRMPVDYKVTADHSNTILKKTIRVKGEGNNDITLDLPVLYDEFVNTADIQVVSSSGKSTRFMTNVYFNSDGSYRLRIFNIGGDLKQDESLSIRVGLTKFDPNNPPERLKGFLDYMKGPLVNDTDFIFDRNYLPDDVKEVVKSLKGNKSLNDTQRMQVLSEWFRRTFTYSLDNRWQKFYEEADSPANYFQRILSNKKVTCEGANTALAVVARSMGLSTRLAWGYMNNGLPIFPVPAQLTENKAHAWVEVFIRGDSTGKGQWIQFDGTPTKLDNTSLRALAQLMVQGPGSFELPGLNDLLNISIDRLGDEAFLYLATIEELVRQHSTEIFSGTSLVIGAAYLAAMAGVTRMRRSLENKFDVQRNIFRKKITEAATTPSIVSSTFLSHADRMFRDFSRKYRIDRGEYDGILSGLTQTINPKLLWRLHQSKRGLERQAPTVENLEEISHYADTTAAVAQATGTDLATIERSLVHENSEMIKRELTQQMERHFEEQIYGSRVRISGVGEDYDWKMRIYMEKTLEKAHSFEEYYDQVTRELFRYRRRYLQKFARLPEEERKEHIKQIKRIGYSHEIPPNTVEALTAFRKSIESEFARPAWVLWKYIKGAQLGNIK